jgi:hypothetical protein
LKFESKTHEAQLEDQNPQKAQEDHLEEGKVVKPQKARKVTNKGKEQIKAQLKNSQPPPPRNKLPLTLSMQALPLR